jgi:hypothetical protein
MKVAVEEFTKRVGIVFLHRGELNTWKIRETGHGGY